MIDNNTVSDVMSYREFVTAVEESVRKRFSKDHDISVQKVLKNNSVELDALTIKERRDRIAPSIYLNEHYESYRNGESIEDISELIERIYRSSLGSFDESCIGSFMLEDVKDRIIYKLISFDRNREALANMPHIRLHDLAVVFGVIIEGRNGYGTIKIDNTRMKAWGTDLETIKAYAADNTSRLLPARFRTMTEVMYSMLTAKLSMLDGDEEMFEKAQKEIEDVISRLEEADGDHPVMYVLTTVQGINGASCLLYDGLLENIREEIGEDYYILPSSINELIIVPISKAGEKELSDMVKMVNDEQVPPQEILSERVYTYPNDTFRL